MIYAHCFHCRAFLSRLVFVTSLLLLLPAGLQASGNDKKTRTPESIDGVNKVDAEGLIELLGQMEDELLLIDARIAADRGHGYIEGSISLPDTETHCDSLAGHISSVDSPVLFYCNGVKCGRSVKSVRTALACGYKRVYWFRGGFEEWIAKGYPIMNP